MANRRQDNTIRCAIQTPKAAKYQVGEMQWNYLNN